MTYNTTGLENADNIAEIVIGLDDVSGHLFGYLFLIGLFVILTVLLLRRFSPADSIFASGLATTVASVGLFSISMVDSESVIICGIITGVAAVAAYLNNR